jgi:hypothetical protein
VKLAFAVVTLEVVHHHVSALDQGNKQNSKVCRVLKAFVGGVLTALGAAKVSLFNLLDFAFITIEHKRSPSERGRYCSYVKATHSHLSVQKVVSHSEILTCEKAHP